MSLRDVEGLKVGQYVWLSGLLTVARDRAHVRMVQILKEGGALPLSLEGGAVYHAGPIAVREDGSWRIVSIGPTTSARFEGLAADLAQRAGVRMLIGKGGLSTKAASTLTKARAIYCSYPGGVGILPAKSVVSVVEVHWLELGPPEALWILKVERLGPLLVSIDLHGGNMYREIEEKLGKKLRTIYERLESFTP